ncbi:transcriptional regulator [Lentzea sp. BCCO 10_0856]|uniref:Transcriptional regulator n=1 Tax=Lentzea miocenica TaxID=3095431 RepID=A0ABU4SW74_9PSEU|nr:transcriptional regulator [Lentzea sp. BCCO 10_0856]MDX8030027.1 transcriptional regulator [Lentzea sp. BCCO 10_0856]
MYLADGGGSSSPPEFGQRKLKVEPSAIPQARKAFEHALDEFDNKIKNAIEQLPTKPWAQDPISSETSKAFNEQTSEKALAAMKFYREQLVGVISQLTMIEAQYRQTEGDNEAMWGKHLRDRD